MKKIEKITIIIFLFILCIKSFSQFKIGIKTGLNISGLTPTMYEDATPYEPKLKPRLLSSVGLIFDYNIINNDKILKIGLQSGLLFAIKGYSINIKKEYNALNGYDRYTFNYLEIPMNVVLKYNKGFQLYGGFYIAKTISAINKYNIEYNDGVIETGKQELDLFMKRLSAYEPGFDETAIRTMDWGLNCGLGYQKKQVLINTGLSFGLMSIFMGQKAKDPDFPVISQYYDSIRANLVASLSVSIFLKNKRK